MSLILFFHPILRRLRENNRLYARQQDPTLHKIRDTPRSRTREHGTYVYVSILKGSSAST